MSTETRDEQRMASACSGELTGLVAEWRDKADYFDGKARDVFNGERTRLAHIARTYRICASALDAKVRESR